MWWPRVFSFIFLLLNYCVAKENPIYQVSGIELLDLIRGFKPRDGMLKLTKVEGDRSSLPDGIYFVPEDDALSPPGEDKYLHINVRSFIIY